MIYKFGDCELNTDLYALRRDGQCIHIRRKVYLLLNYLLEHRDRVVSKEDLCDSIWDGRHVSNTTIESTVMAARRALGDSGETQRVIQTLPCYGYRFVLPLDAIQSSQEEGDIYRCLDTTD
ncbi:MAG: winged helix-turn-helix domain-containing protein [Gammaproteobacteria bacterium]